MTTEASFVAGAAPASVPPIFLAATANKGAAVLQKLQGGANERHEMVLRTVSGTVSGSTTAPADCDLPGTATGCTSDEQKEEPMAEDLETKELKKKVYEWRHRHNSAPPEVFVESVIREALDAERIEQTRRTIATASTATPGAAASDDEQDSGDEWTDFSPELLHATASTAAPITAASDDEQDSGDDWTDFSLELLLTGPTAEEEEEPQSKAALTTISLKGTPEPLDAIIESNGAIIESNEVLQKILSCAPWRNHRARRNIPEESRSLPRLLPPCPVGPPPLPPVEPTSEEEEEQ